MVLGEPLLPAQAKHCTNPKAYAVQALMERGSPGHYMLGLKILNMLVQEMNQPTPGRTLSTVGETGMLPWNCTCDSCTCALMFAQHQGHNSSMSF